MHISLVAPQETALTHHSPLSSEKCHSCPIAVLTLPSCIRAIKQSYHMIKQ